MPTSPRRTPTPPRGDCAPRCDRAGSYQAPAWEFGSTRRQGPQTLCYAAVACKYLRRLRRCGKVHKAVRFLGQAMTLEDQPDRREAWIVGAGWMLAIHLYDGELLLDRR